MIGTGFKFPLPDCNYESYEAISLENTRLYTQLDAKSAKPRHKFTRIQSQTPEAYLGSYGSHSFKENSLSTLPSHPHRMKPSKSSAIKYTLRKLDYKSYFTNKKPLEDSIRQEALRINLKDVNRPISRPKSATRTSKEAKELISIEDEYLRKQIVLTNNITFKPLSNASKLKTLKYIENNGNKAIELLKKRELMRKKNYGEQSIGLTRPPRSISSSCRANESRRNVQTPSLRSDILTVTRCPTSTRSRSLNNSRKAERVISTSETQTNLSIEAPVSSCSISRNFSISEGESQEEESPTYNLRRCYG